MSSSSFRIAIIPIGVILIFHFYFCISNSDLVLFVFAVFIPTATISIGLVTFLNLFLLASSHDLNMNSRFRPCSPALLPLISSCCINFLDRVGVGGEFITVATNGGNARR